MPATLTPLRYPGGKSKYVNLFADVVSKNRLVDCTFVEVFAGGAGSAISLLLRKKVSSLILNDLDIAIYSFWRAVKERSEDLVQLIEAAPINITEWKRQKAIYENRCSDDWLSLGFATFYLNRSNHSGILHARPIGGMEQLGSYHIGSRFNRTTSVAKIRAIAQRASALELFNLDGRDFVEMLKKEYRDRQLLIYFDPPYYQKGPALYLNHLQHEDHEILRDSIVGCPFPWILSYDDHPSVIDLYRNRDCRLYRNQIRHTINGNQWADELIVSKLKLPSSLKPVRFRK